MAMRQLTVSTTDNYNQVAWSLAEQGTETPTERLSMRHIPGILLMPLPLEAAHHSE